MRVVVFQPPMVGRENLAASLAEALEVPRVSFGNLMRHHLHQRTEFGNRALEIINAGELFPDEFLIAVVRDHLSRMADTDFLLDGYPRSIAQASALDLVLSELSKPLYSALHVRLSQAAVERRISRLTVRRVCESGHSFEPEVNQLRVDGLCNVCGGELHQRADDSEDVVRHRFTSHDAMLEPVIQHYAERDLLLTVDAVGISEETTSRVLAALRGQPGKPVSPPPSLP